MAGGSSLRFSFLCGLRELIPRISISLDSDNRWRAYLWMKATTSMIDTHRCFETTTRNDVVGHLPREISRFTYYIIIHGGKSVSCLGIDVHHRPLLLAHYSLEIPTQVTVTMDLYRRKERTGDKKISEWVKWAEEEVAENAGACVVNLEITYSIYSKVLQGYIIVWYYF